MGRLIIYEGSDEEIRKFLSSLPVHAGALNATGTGQLPVIGNTNPTHWDQIAQAFQKQIRKTAAGGRKGQLNAILAWLKHDGAIELTALWQASGVKNQHDYGGIGSSLTRHMKKAGGLKDWYSAEPHTKKTDEWVYKIVPELIEPLKKAFGV
jgi:hypothetical protein